MAAPTSPGKNCEPPLRFLPCGSGPTAYHRSMLPAKAAAGLARAEPGRRRRFLQDHADWSHYDPQLPEIIENPYPAYTWLREHAPVHYIPRLESYVLSRYDDIKQAAANVEVFSNVGGVGFRPPKALRDAAGFPANESGGSG